MPLTTETEFARLVERHRRELHVHCYRMLGNFEEAEDLVQETMLRAWRGRAGLERDEWARAWLYKIATNACLDRIKANQRRQPALASPHDIPWLQPYPDRLLDELEQAGATQAAPGEEEPEAQIVARETIELTFLAVMQLLPPRQRAVIVLRDVLDWPAQDVAGLLEIGVAAVNSALQRARQTIQKNLPTNRRETWKAPVISDEERAVLERYVESHESGDFDMTLDLIHEDIIVTMPPHPLIYQGLEALAGLQETARGMDEWRVIPTSANRMPAGACYNRAPGDDTFRAFKLDVLRVVDGRIAEFTTFGSELFEAFGLPATLPD